MNLDDVLQTFIAEGRELLEQMEEALLRIEQAPDDLDTLNAIFRAAHTIKGSAGLFGIDYIVAFTHVAESVLDRVRGLELGITSELVALLLAVSDHLGRLIDHVAEARQPDDATLGIGLALTERLGVFLESRPWQDGVPAPADPLALAAPSPASAGPGGESGPESGGARAATANWHLSLRFGADVLRHGMDPLAFLRYLETLGRIDGIVTLREAVPALDALDAERSYLGYEISYRSAADLATIEGAFEFVRADARIRILPPHSALADYLGLFDDLPEAAAQCGELLLRSGSLTPDELARAARAVPSGASDIGDAVDIGETRTADAAGAPAAERRAPGRELRSAEGSLIRVNAEKLDEHINLIGELIIASAGTGLIAQRANIPELAEAAARLSRLVDEVRDSALTLRMVQIGATFTKFQRVVRDVSAELGKDIRLAITGAETELDKTVVEKIGDPLTHLMRNAMDHGIEAADLRLARGKPAHGTIRLNAFHDSGSIVIEVADDGGGLDKARIIAKAVASGLIKAEQTLSEQEIHHLIFEPGFSTAEKVNNLSGRGVGMDVVRRNITALRGSVEIDSVPGEGTTMRIRLPLTLAIIDGFLVGVGASSFVVPLEMVVECVELSPEETLAAKGRDHLNLRGEVLPFIRLKELFAIADPPPPEEGEGEDETDGGRFGADAGGVVLTAEGAAALAADPELAFLLRPVRRENVVVVQYAGHRAGLVVESLLGEFQTVIRPLGQVFDGLDGIAGFTILGSGLVALILDVPGLVRRVAARDSRRNRRPLPALLPD